MNNEQIPDAPKDEKFFTLPLLIILITVFIDLIGFGMVIPILPLYAETPPFNATPFEIGMLFSIYSWMQFFFAPILGRLSDKYGRRPILFISLLGSAVGYWVIGAATTLFLVFLGRVISGVTGGNISTAQAYIADITTKENRARGMGLFGATFGLGFVFGPAIAGILSKYGIHVPFYFAAGLSFVNAIALYFVLPETRRKSVEAAVTNSRNRFAQLFEAFENKFFAIVTLNYFLVITSFSIMTYAFVLYTSYRFGYDAEQNGYLFAYIGILAIIMQGSLFGRLAKKFGEAKLVVAGSLMLVASLFVVPFIGPDFGGLTGLLIGIAFFSLGNSLASPALTTLASKSADDETQGKSLGTMQSAASLARAIGPTIGGVLLSNVLGEIDDTTLYRTFWAASAIMLLAFALAIYSAKNQARFIETQN